MNRRILKDIIIPVIFYSCLLFACQLLVMLTFEVVLVAVQDGVSMEAAINAAVDTLVSQIYTIEIAADILVIIVLVAISRVKKVSFSGFILIKKRVSFKTMVYAVIAGAAFYFWVTYMLAVLPIPSEMMNSYSEATEALADRSLIAVIASVLFAPFVEEALFRGLVYKHLRICMSGYFAVLLQALAFAANHGPSKIWMAYALVAGLLFGYVTMLTGSIRASVLMHMTFNGIDSLLSFVSNAELITALCYLSPFILLLSVYGILKESNKTETVK